MNTDNDILLILDASYIAYYCLYSAVTKWKDNFYSTGLETIELPEPGSVPYDDLPDLVTETSHFKRVLMETANEKMSAINDIVYGATGLFYGNSMGKCKIDTVVARDSHGGESFRKAIYPEYKMQRQTNREERNDFNHWKIMDYIYSVILPDMLPKGNTWTIKLPNAEGDDIVASLVMSPKLKERYKKILLISSDHDYLQLHKPDNRIRQFNMKNEEILCEFQQTQGGRKVKIQMTPDQALLMKIITGDSSDNIPGIKRGVGPVRAWKLICENARENLMNLFESDREALVAFQMNRKLIAFDEIPKELQDEIIEEFFRKSAA